MLLRDLACFLKDKKPKCLQCGKRLDLSELKWYPHKRGVVISDVSVKPQWFYFECSKCSYQNSLVKLVKVYCRR